MFDDTLLFDIDKFSGYDRFETGTRANVGVQYTFQANNGLYARAVFGQSFHLAGENAFADPGLELSRRVANWSAELLPVSGLETDRSDYVAGLYLSPVQRPQPHRQAGSTRRTGRLRRQDTFLQANYGPVSARSATTFTHFDPTPGVFDKQQE